MKILKSNGPKQKLVGWNQVFFPFTKSVIYYAMLKPVCYVASYKNCCVII